MLREGVAKIEKNEAPAGRACWVTPSTALFIPSHLDNLYRRTVSCLQDSQRSEATALLTEFGDVFAHSADDLVRTIIVKHEIRTNKSKLVRQNPRRSTTSQRAVAEAEINMLKRGVIEALSSPWAFPVVLVRKKDGTTCSWPASAKKPTRFVFQTEISGTYTVLVLISRVVLFPFLSSPWGSVYRFFV